MTLRVLLRLLLALVICASVCRAQEDTTTKTIVAPGKAGRPDIRCDSTYRGKKCIMRVFSEKRVSGEFVPYARSFQIAHAMLTESDEDRDGFFETLAIIDDTDGRSFVEVFKRERDGSVHPVTREELKKTQESFDRMAAFWKEFEREAPERK
jgi:hypothetical protein